MRIWAMGLAVILAQASQAKLICPENLDSFEKSTVGEFPAGWQVRNSRDFKKAKSLNMYSIFEEAGEKFLRANYSEKAVTLHRVVKDRWDLVEYPILQWKWRARTLPAQADENVSSKNDAAAAIYVIWDAGFVMRVKSIKFSWSSTLPVDTLLKKRLGHDFVQVVDSGAEYLNEWQSHLIDVRLLYKNYFNKEVAENPIALAILTDADSTKTQAAADYGPIRFCKNVESSFDTKK